MIKPVKTLLALAALSGTTTALAQTTPAAPSGPAPAPVSGSFYTALNADQIGVALKELGYTFKRLTDSKGQAYFQITMGSFDSVYLDLYGCNAGNCNALQIYASFDKGGNYPVAKVNEWNNNYFTQAFLNERNNPGVSSYTKLSGGVTINYLKGFVRDFQQTMVDFTKFIDF